MRLHLIQLHQPKKMTEPATKVRSKSVSMASDASNFEYIYKITSATPLHLLDVADRSQPILHVSALDNVSQFIHMSLPAQLPGTLCAFFPTQQSELNTLYLLRCRLDQWTADECRWEPADPNGGPREGEGLFAHLFLKHEDGSKRLWLRISEVDSVRELISPEGELGWEKRLAELSAWLV